MRSGHLGIGESFGVVDLAFATDGVAFPAHKQELIERLGNRKISWTRNTVVNLRDVLQSTSSERFESFSDLLAAVAHHEDRGARKITEFV
ncbi:MAG: hypothetical protein HY366_00055 [Candidatus Aenigmarchaeota archaeon]|nr:hypothetical protein [Candidatus Aenigmarchaeota archaeon]